MSSLLPTVRTPHHSLRLNLDGLLEKIWEMMALVRVYTKRIGSKPDFDQPVVLTKDRGGTNVEALCGQIHKTLAKEFKYGLVWGTSSKHVSGTSLTLSGHSF